MRRLKGLTDLLFASVENITNLVERTHTSVASRVFQPLAGTAPTAPVGYIVKVVHDSTKTGVYRIIRGVNRGVKDLVDIGTEWKDSEFSDARGKLSRDLPSTDAANAAESRARFVDLAESALNALYGDYLHREKNALDLGMTFQHQGKELPVEREALRQRMPDSLGKIVLFIHGLACTERVWNISAEEFHGEPHVNFGTMFKNELGYTPLYIRYNTGRHISENGQQLSRLLARLVAAYPRDIEEIVLVGHSMGGLLARSAAHYGSRQNEAWVQQLRGVVCLGAPNFGAPLEKGANVLANLLGAFETAGTQIPAEILRARSAGIKDLRFGYTVDEEWLGKNPDSLMDDNRQDVALVDGVGYYFVGAAVTRDTEHPMGVLLGDLLVRLPSATGQAPDSTRSIPFRSGRVFSGMNHLHMANHPQVYQVIKLYLQCRSGEAKAAADRS